MWKFYLRKDARPSSYGSGNGTTPTNEDDAEDEEEEEIVRVIRFDGQFSQIRGSTDSDLELVNPYQPLPEYNVDPIEVHDKLITSGKYGDLQNYRNAVRGLPNSSFANDSDLISSPREIRDKHASPLNTSKEEQFDTTIPMSSTPIMTANWRSKSRASTTSNISTDTVKQKVLLANQKAANSPSKHLVTSPNMVTSPVTNSIPEEYGMRSPATDILPQENKRSRSRQEIEKWLENQTKVKEGSGDDSLSHESNNTGPAPNVRHMYDNSPTSNSKSLTSPPQGPPSAKSPLNYRLESLASPTGSKQPYSRGETKQSLKQKLQDEKEARKQQDDYIRHLQSFYSSLLEKHALAEVTIDQLRLGAKTNYDAIITLKGRRDGGDSDTLRTRSAMSRPLSQQIDSPFDSSIRGFNALSPFLDGHNRSLPATPQFMNNTWEGAKLGVMLHMNDLQEGLNHLERCLSVLSQTWSEDDSEKQQKLCKHLREKYETIQAEFKNAGQMYDNATREYNQEGYGESSVFDPEGILEGKLFNLGLRLDDLETEAGNQLRMNKRRTPFRPPDLDSADGSRNRRASMPASLTGRLLEQEGRLSNLSSPYLPDGSKLPDANLSQLENTFQDLLRKYEESLDERTHDTDQEVENLISQLRDISIRANGKSEIIQTPQALEEKLSRDRDTVNTQRPGDKVDKQGASDSEKSNTSENPARKKRGESSQHDSGFNSRLSNQKSVRHPRGGDTNSSIADDSGILSAADTNQSRRPGDRLGSYGNRMRGPAPSQFQDLSHDQEVESGGSSSSMQGDGSSSSRLRNEDRRRALRRGDQRDDSIISNKDDEQEPEIESSQINSKQLGRSPAKGSAIRTKRSAPVGKLRSGRVSSSLASLRVTPAGEGAAGEFIGLPSLPAAADQLPSNMRRMSKRSDSGDGSRERKLRRQGRQGSTTSHDSARSDRIRDLEEEVRHLKEQLGTGASEMSFDDHSSLNLEQYDPDYRDGDMHSDEDDRYLPTSRGKSYGGRVGLDDRKRSSPDNRAARRRHYDEQQLDNDIEEPIREKRGSRARRAPTYRGREEIYSDEDDRLSNRSDGRRGRRSFRTEHDKEVWSDQDTDEDMIDERPNIRINRPRTRGSPDKGRRRQRTNSRDQGSQTKRSRSVEKGVNVRLKKEQLWSDDDSLSDDFTSDYEYHTLPSTRLHRFRRSSPLPPGRSILRTHHRYPSPPTPTVVRHSYANSPIRSSSLVPCSSCGGSGLLEEELGLYSASGGPALMPTDLALPLREYRTQNQMQNYYVREYGPAGTPSVARSRPVPAMIASTSYDLAPETRLYTRRRRRSASLPRKPKISADYYEYVDDLMSQRFVKDSLDIALKTAKSMNRLSNRLRNNVKRDINSFTSNRSDY